MTPQNEIKQAISEIEHKDNILDHIQRKAGNMMSDIMEIIMSEAKISETQYCLSLLKDCISDMQWKYEQIKIDHELGSHLLTQAKTIINESSITNGNHPGNGRI